ncbi:hypothetical protein [Treponema maltophilum]|uniref:hypothetical protein n=1 Tax=Treponema maltophilum TaxID=51160 RepID=UPI003D8EEB57
MRYYNAYSHNIHTIKIGKRNIIGTKKNISVNVLIIKTIIPIAEEIKNRILVPTIPLEITCLDFNKKNKSKKQNNINEINTKIGSIRLSVLLQ